MNTLPRTVLKMLKKLLPALEKKLKCLGIFLKWGKNTSTHPKKMFGSCFTSLYRITYLINTDGNISILGVFHGALDINRYLT